MTPQATPPRLDPVLTVVDVMFAARDSAADRLWGRRCPVCYERTRHQRAHHFVDHASDRVD